MTQMMMPFQLDLLILVLKNNQHLKRFFVMMRLQKICLIMMSGLGEEFRNSRWQDTVECIKEQTNIFIIISDSFEIHIPPINFLFFPLEFWNDSILSIIINHKVERKPVTHWQWFTTDTKNFDMLHPRCKRPSQISLEVKWLTKWWLNRLFALLLSVMADDAMLACI